MSKREILVGATDQTIDILIKDSSSTVGAGLTGLAFNTASLTCYYRKGATGTPTALTLATQTVGGAHSDGGFVAVDGTNCPGQYRLDLSDTIVNTAGMVYLHLRGATNMVPCVVEIEVVSVNKFDAMRMGMTALPNALPDNAGGLPVSDAGGLDMDGMRADVAAILVDTGTTLDGRIPAALGANGNMKADVRDYSGTAGTFSGGRPEVNTSHWGGTAVASALVRGNVIQWTGTNVETPDTAGVPNVNMTYLNNNGATVDNIGNVFGTDFATNYDDTNNRWLVDVRMISGDATAADNAEAFFDGTGYAGTNNVIPTVTTVTNQLTAAQIATGVWTDTTASDFTTALSIGKSIMNGVSLGTGLTINAYTGNTPQTGDSYAIVNSGTHGNAAIKGYVDDIGTAGAGLTAIPWNAAWDAEVQSECADALTAYAPATAAQVNAEVLDVINVDTLIDGKTIKEAVRIIAATTASVIAGAGTGTEVFKGLDGTTTRVTVTVDSSGNRSAVVYA